LAKRLDAFKIYSLNLKANTVLGAMATEIPMRSQKPDLASAEDQPSLAWPERPLVGIPIWAWQDAKQ